MSKLISFFTRYHGFLKDYYLVSSIEDLLNALREDILISFFLQSGSGLFTSVIKGYMAQFFIDVKFPILIGKRTRIVGASNIKIGKRVRIKDDVSLIAHGKIVIGDDVIIGEKTTLCSMGNGLYIGNGVTITRSCYIAQLGGRIKIGDNVLVGDYTRMYTSTHSFINKKLPISRQKNIHSEIEIKKNSWIGAGVTIINDVIVGTGSVIGAHTLVNKNVPDYVVFAGIPGKIIKKI